MLYKGVIIAESLENKSVLQSIKITQTKIEIATPEHKTPWVKQWTLHTVEIPEDQLENICLKISQALDSKHAWYADFKNENYHYIIFYKKIFKVDRGKPQDYKAVTEYGLTLSIPSYQLDFSPSIKQWERKTT